MSGYALSEIWHAGRSLRRDQLWRDDMMLHQLTLNGSMLLAPNHDRQWRALIADSMAQPADTEWVKLCKLLKLLPTPLARRALWRTSYRWWLLRNAALINGQLAAMRYGAYDRFNDLPGVQAMQVRLERVAEQLTDLEWCDTSTDGADRTIEIVDLREAQRQAQLAKQKKLQAQQRQNRKASRKRDLTS